MEGDLANLIEQRVELARQGQNPYVICRMASGWLVIGDVQPLPGYCVLLADPVVESLNAMTRDQRIQYSLDMVEAGDAVLAVTDAYRINYETLGNAEPALHTHIIPRYRREPEEKRRRPAWVGYDWPTSRRFDVDADRAFVAAMRARLADQRAQGG
jgi:diadenosine tetraphosphate (Ap4A) HIT family hydrolase